MRAEDVFGFTKRVQLDKLDLDEIYDELSAAYHQSEQASYGQKLAVNAVDAQRRSLETRYGKNPDAQSHGETFLAIMEERLAPPGLFLLDEPEGPLAPTRILALMMMIKEGLAKGSQFIIATHSPILLAMPGAEVFSFENGHIQKVPYEEVDHVKITKAFLNNPESFLEHL